MILDKLKRIKLSRLQLSEKETNLFNLINSCEIKKYSQLPNSLLYIKDNEILLETCFSNEYVYFSRSFYDTYYNHSYRTPFK